MLIILTRHQSSTPYINDHLPQIPECILSRKILQECELNLSILPKVGILSSRKKKWELAAKQHDHDVQNSRTPLCNEITTLYALR